MISFSALLPSFVARAIKSNPRRRRQAHSHFRMQALESRQVFSAHPITSVSGAIPANDPGAEEDDDGNDESSEESQRTIYFSTENPGSYTNPDGSVVRYDDSDILELSMNEDGEPQVRLYFDGSDVGLTTNAEDIDAIAFMPDGSILLSTVGDVSVSGVSNGRREDVLRFEPTSLGDRTAGRFTMYLDGSDVGLSTATENIDSLDVLSDGSLIISTTGNVAVGGVSNGRREDLLQFTPTSTGNDTRGTFRLYFDGSDVGLTTTGENIDNVVIDEDSPILLMTQGDYSVTGAAGTANDIVMFEADQLGSTTRGSFSIDDAAGESTFDPANLDALEIVISESNSDEDPETDPEPDPQPTPNPIPTPVPTPTPTPSPAPNRDDHANQLGSQATSLRLGANGSGQATGTIEQRGDTDVFQINVANSGPIRSLSIAGSGV